MSADHTSIAASLRPRGPVTLRLARRAEPDLTLLRADGEVDLLTVGRLGADLDQEVRQGDGDVLVDLRGTAFVDSAGLHVLLNAQRRLTRRGRSLAVVCEPGPVRRVFELAKLIDTLCVVSSVREYRGRAERRRGGSRPAVTAEDPSPA